MAKLLALVACTGWAIALTAAAKPPKLAAVDFSACANANLAAWQPVGVSVGNTPARDAKLSFTLLDPGAGNNVWIGGAGGTLTLNVSVGSHGPCIC
jgi:hypothetical protein